MTHAGRTGTLTGIARLEEVKWISCTSLARSFATC